MLNSISSLKDGKIKKWYKKKENKFKTAPIFMISLIGWFYCLLFLIEFISQSLYFLFFCKRSISRIYIQVLLLQKLMLCLLLSTMLSSMANSMIKVLNLPLWSLTSKTVHLIMVVADNLEIARDSTNPLFDAVNIVTDCLDTLKAEGVVGGGDVPGTLPRLLPVSNMPELSAPSDHKLRVSVAHPGVSAMNQSVGDGVWSKLVEVDHPHPMAFFCCQGQLRAARTLTLNFKQIAMLFMLILYYDSPSTLSTSTTSIKGSSPKLSAKLSMALSTLP
jgi:hypothetical protein